MSDEHRNRPDPATDPMLPDPGRFKPIDRYRPDPRRAAADEERGRITHTEQERQALVDRNARALAEATAAGLAGPGPVRPAVADVLRDRMETNVAEQVGPLLTPRAQAVADLQRAEDDVKTADEEVTESETTVATITADPPAAPAGGRHLTQPWVLLLIIPVLVYVETKLTAPSLRAALATTASSATLVAGAIAFVSVVVAEFLGAALAAMVTGRRRAARCLLGLLALITVVTLAIGIAQLASSREANVKYLDRLKGQASTQADGFDGRRRQPKAAAPAGSPSLGFVVPLTLAGLLAACGLAMRVALAAPVREWEGRKAAAEHEVDRHRDRLDEAQDTRAAARAALDENDLQIGAIVEVEQGVHNGLVDRLRGEYVRACQAIGTRPVELVTEPLNPDQRPIHHRLIDPDRATSTQPVVVPTQVEPDAAERAPDDAPPPPGAEPLMPVPEVPLPHRGGGPPPPPPPAPPPGPGPTDPPAAGPAPVPRGSWLRNGRPTAWQLPTNP